VLLVRGRKDTLLKFFINFFSGGTILGPGGLHFGCLRVAFITNPTVKENISLLYPADIDEMVSVDPSWNTDQGV